MEIIKSLTPEEYETVQDCIRELKTNSKYYSVGFATMALSFSYWQRVYLPRKFHIWSVIVGGFAGVTYATVKTSLYAAERIDMLGKDYEISRMVKQDVFDTRRDLKSGERAQFY